VGEAASELANAGSMPGVTAAYRHLHDDAVRLLTGYQPTSVPQQRVRAELLEHLAAHPDAVAKAGPPAHLTASALVLDATGTHILLTHHRKAEAWLQLGGHLEPTDPSVWGAAAREVLEESGIPGVVLRPDIAQLHRHTLEGAFGTCREHLDVRFAGVAPAGALPTVSEESYDVRWWPVDALPAQNHDELTELLADALRVLGPADPADSDPDPGSDPALGGHGC
jgi:8-oxo-dGTP pyrophosphatase MutT (NUDIX family)